MRDESAFQFLLDAVREMRDETFDIHQRDSSVPAPIRIDSSLDTYWCVAKIGSSANLTHSIARNPGKPLGSSFDCDRQGRHHLCAGARALARD